MWNGPETLSLGANWISEQPAVVFVVPNLPDQLRLPRAGQRVVPQLFVAQVR